MSRTQNPFRLTLLASAVALSSHSVFAQNNRVIEEVVVTAQKTVQSLQDVPISVSALSGDFMQDNAIGDLVEVSTYVPNVRVEFTSPSSPQVFIRGFGTNTFNPSFEPAVGLVQDEIFFGRGTYFTESMFDLERVEVLRGPQGTLFGKNTIAGVFNVSSRSAPGEEGSAGNLSYKSGDYGDRRIEAGLGYRFSPSLGMRVSALLSDRDGRIENTKVNRKEDTRDQDAFRAKLEWNPTDSLDLELVAQTSDTTLNFWPRQLMNLDQDTRDYLSQFDPQIEDDPTNFQTSFNNPGEMFKGSDTVLARGNWSFGPMLGLSDFATTLIVGVSWLDVTQFQDLDVSPADLLNLDEVDDYRQESLEWRFSGNADSLFGLGGNVQFLAGAYYFQSDFHLIADVIIGQDISSYALTKDAQQLLSGSSTVPGNPLGGPIGGSLPTVLGSINPTDFYRFDYFQDTEATSLFGQIVWDITDKWVLTPGLRVNRETKKSTPTGTGICTNKQVAPCITSTVISARDYAPGEIERTESNLSPKVALSYYLTNDVSFYGSWSKGFKSGGVNSISFTGEGLEYDPEKAQSWEFGLRSQLLENTLQLNATAYRMDFDDLQVLAFNGLFFDVTNAAAAFSQGVELDLQWLTPYAPLTLNASLGYLKAEYKKYPSAPSPISEGQGVQQDLGGKTLAFAPEFNGTVSPTLEYQIGDFLLKSSLNIIYQSSHFTDTDLDPNTEIPSTVTYSAHISLKSLDGGWALTVGGKNLSDERELNQVIDTAMFPGTYNPSQNPGREVFTTLSYRW